MTPPDEHARWARYEHSLKQLLVDDEIMLVAEILSDPDPAMAQSAIARHIDRRAAAMHQEAQYPAWAKRIAGPVNRYPFLARRLREWSLFRAITLASDCFAAVSRLVEVCTGQRWFRLAIPRVSIVRSLT
jgi:hypothetical protein